MELFLLLVCLFVFPLSICLLYSYSDSVSCLLWSVETERTYAYPLYFTYYALWQCFYVMFNVYIIWNSIIPYNFIKMLIFSPLTSVLPLMLLVVFALKGHSFIFTNYGLEKQSTEHVPNSFGHFCYFMYHCSSSLISRVCPTLLYELDYPRTTTIRLGYIVRTSMYMVAAFILMYVIMMQVLFILLDLL